MTSYNIVLAIWTGRHYNISMNIHSPPHRLNNTFIQDEIFINVRKDQTLTKADEIWIESSEQNLLARVPVHSTNKIGYRAVKMRGVSLKWMNNLRNSRGLRLKMKSAKKTKKSLKKVIGAKAYFVVYVYSTEALLNLSKAVTCDSYDVTIKFQSILALDSFQTKICSPPDDVTFPFDVSSVFDVGMAFRRALHHNPVPKGASVLRNPKCCQATKVAPRSFVNFVNGNIQVSRLRNVQITECGCWTK